MKRLRKFITWFRDAATPPRRRKSPGRHHDTIKTTGRWNHRSVASRYDVPEDVVRRIYAAVQTAKRQGLYGGYMFNLIERSVGRKLVGDEYIVGEMARAHLGYNPQTGYGGPQPKGSAKEPKRASGDDPNIQRASRMESGAKTTLKDVLGRRKHPSFGWDESNDSKDRDLLRHAADELDVAADLYEGGGSGVHAGTLRECAKYARHGNYRRLASYC